MAVQFLRGLGAKVPDYDRSEVTSCDLGHVDPVERRSDVAIMLRGPGPSGALDRLMGIVVEVQRDEKKRKCFTWPEYVAALRSKHECPVTLLVICPKQSVADWYSEPIELGHPGLVLRPLVIGPKDIPVVTDPGTVAASPTLGVLSAAAHGMTKPDVLEALHTGLDAIDPEDAAKYLGYSLHLLANTEGQKALEALMMANTFDYHSPWVDSLRAEGEAKGEAKAILRVLARRGIPVSAQARERISRCTDLETLGTWIDRSVSVATEDELFAE
ncbi:hypothetical protein DFP74_3612 [Nocardiopsis sp. Huas11]|uniref:hypothetical protein n=1 Tax=Nocardiopsis sp. Huas11 TaxID=2183912 RepID=UPI000F22F3B0|nr:hypothetical protein [Nocardiopsis sp. Huas11]RKS07924.1 hypothetical protein DFP74_3612 [Nocardiopsis sp. Huas11]